MRNNDLKRVSAAMIGTRLERHNLVLFLYCIVLDIVRCTRWTGDSHWPGIYPKSLFTD